MIEIRDLIGTASPFKQGGSLRITLPKKIARGFAGRVSLEELQEATLFFVGTNVGILMCTLSDLQRNPMMKEMILSPSSQTVKRDH